MGGMKQFKMEHRWWHVAISSYIGDVI